MLTAYLDDSGTHGGPYCIIAGYFASEERWAAFSIEWNTLCGKYLNGRPFKMCKANREKDHGYVSESGLIEFAECIVRHVEGEIWSVLPEYYHSKVQEKTGRGFDKYRLCVFGALRKTIFDGEMQKKQDLLSWVFDHHGGGDDPENDSEIEISLHRGFNDVQRVATGATRNLLHALAFANDETTLPLQAADFLAWQKRRYHAEDVDAPVRTAYEILRSAKIKRIEEIWFDYKLEELMES